MRLQKPNSANKPGPAARSAPAPAAPARRKRWLVVAAVAVLLAAAGWGAWSLWRPDPLREARAALDRRDFPTANELLAKRLVEKPGDAEALLLAARAARRAGELSRALDHLQKYRDRFGANDASELESALLRAQAGDVREADRLFAGYSARGDSPDAPLVMEAYLEGKLRVLAPRGGRADLNSTETLAAVEASAADLHRAVDLWLAARPGRADQLQGHLWRARVFLAANKYPEGVAALREAVGLDPDHLEARFQLALSVSLSAPDEARRHLELLLARYPDNPFVRLGLANTYRILGRGPEARRIYEGLLAGQHRADALVELGTLDLEEGKLEDAERRLRAALEIAPHAPDANIAMSRLQHLAGRPADAEKYRKRAEEFDAAKNPPKP